MINWPKLDAVKPEDFHQAKPFPHVVIDGAFDHAQLVSAVEEWPGPTANGWKQYQRGKRAHAEPALTRPHVQHLMRVGNSAVFVDWLRKLTDITDLQPDFALQGGGLHEVETGGSLGMHVDFNRNGDLYRRINAIVYLNREWSTEWGGALELRDHPLKPTNSVQIFPGFNRLVIFEASERSWHGHPRPLMCPAEITRKSCAWYYYSATPHPTYKTDHSTVYLR